MCVFHFGCEWQQFCTKLNDIVQVNDGMENVYRCTQIHFYIKSLRFSLEFRNTSVSHC